MTPWQSLAKSFGRTNEAPIPDFFQELIDANPAIYWYPGSGNDFTSLILDSPTNPTGRRLFPLNGNCQGQPVILWMNDYAKEFLNLGRIGQVFEINTGKLDNGKRSIQGLAEILPGAACVRLNTSCTQRGRIPLTIFQVKITGGAGKHQRSKNGEVYTVVFSAAESEQLFRQVFLRHSLKLEVVALICQGSWGSCPQRFDFDHYTAIPRLCAQHQETIGKVQAYLLDNPKTPPQGYENNYVRVEGWGLGAEMWIPNHKRVPKIIVARI